MNWGPIKWGHHDETFQPLEEMDAKVVRVLKSARNCMCPHGDYWREVNEMTRLADRLDVIGEDYEECGKVSISQWSDLG